MGDWGRRNNNFPVWTALAAPGCVAHPSSRATARRLRALPGTTRTRPNWELIVAPTLTSRHSTPAWSPLRGSREGVTPLNGFLGRPWLKDKAERVDY
jgi:hypothetical protein